MAAFPAGVSWEGHTTLLKAVFLIFVSVFVSVIISCVQSVFLVLCPFLVLVIAKFWWILLLICIICFACWGTLNSGLWSPSSLRGWSLGRHAVHDSCQLKLLVGTVLFSSCLSEVFDSWSNLTFHRGPHVLPSLSAFWKTKRNIYLRAGEMAQHLGALTAFPENPDSLPAHTW